MAIGSHRRESHSHRTRLKWTLWYPDTGSLPHRYGVLILAFAPINVVFYWGIVIVEHAIDYYLKYQERELRTSQLEAQLVAAELQVLKMQLHPHFLFNTLNTISALIHESPDEADEMISQLGDLLRMTLDTVHVHEVALTQELDFLKHYLAIEQTRFQDRLGVLWQLSLRHSMLWCRTSFCNRWLRIQFVMVLRCVPRLIPSRSNRGAITACCACEWLMMVQG